MVTKGATRRISILLAISLATALASPPAGLWPVGGAQASAGIAEATLIIPGQSLGPVRLGMPIKSLQQTAGWGQPDSSNASGSIVYMTYARHDITVAVRDDQVVLALTSSERYRTERGVAVGRPVSAAVSAHGQAQTSGDERLIWYDSIGLVLGIGSGTIIRIGVFDPRNFVRAILADERPARDVFLTAAPPKLGAVQGTGASAVREASVTVTLRNLSRSSKVLNPNFFALTDREGQVHRYDRATFRLDDACRSTVTVRVGASASCTLLFMLPAGRAPRSIAFDDGASADQHFF